MPKVLFPLLVAIAAILVFAENAKATNIGDPFPLEGSTATFKAVGLVLLTSPLPSLDGGGKVMLTPSGGIMKVATTNDHAADLDALNPGFKFRYYGEATGQNAGLTLSFYLSDDFSFYALVGGAKLSGEYSKTVNDVPEHKLTEFSGQTIAGALGLQYRLVGNDTSTFALGLFAGPMYYSSESKAKYQKISSGPGITDVSAKPTGIGALLGMRMMFRIGGFRINPYLKMMGDLGDMCKKVDFSGGPVNSNDYTCDDKPGYIGAPAFAGGLGLLIGYKSFMISVATSTDDSSELRPESTSLSLGISL